MVTPESDPSEVNDRDDEKPTAEEAAQPEETGEDEIELTEEQLEDSPEPEKDLQEQLEEAQQRALRQQAELENTRKRMRREMEEQQRYAGISLMRDLLPALDNLRRAVEAAEPSEANEAVLSGVQMVCGQLESILTKHQCNHIEAEGTMFDPNLHEAVVQQPTSEHPPGTVVKEIQAGYQLLDRIVRPSQVMVAQAPENSSEEDPETQQHEDS